MTTVEITFPVDEDIQAILVTAARLGAVDGDDAQAMEGDADQQMRALWEADSRRTMLGMMRAARRLRAEMQSDAAYLETFVKELARRAAPRERSLTFLEDMIEDLAAQLLPEGSAHVDVPGAGRVQYRNLKASLRIADPAAFMAALGPDEQARLVEQRPHLKTDEAKEYAQAVKETGEILPGVEFVPARRTASIQYEAAL